MVKLPTTCNPTCVSCRWFHDWIEMKRNGKTVLLGKCRVEAPTQSASKWPQVWEHDFCGRHALVQNEQEIEGA